MSRAGLPLSNHTSNNKMSTNQYSQPIFPLQQQYTSSTGSQPRRAFPWQPETKVLELHITMYSSQCVNVLQCWIDKTVAHPTLLPTDGIFSC